VSGVERRTYQRQRVHIQPPQPLQRCRRKRVAGDVVDDARQAANLPRSIQQSRLLPPRGSEANEFHGMMLLMALTWAFSPGVAPAFFAAVNFRSGRRGHTTPQSIEHRGARIKHLGKTFFLARVFFIAGKNGIYWSETHCRICQREVLSKLIGLSRRLVER
jgi:hypothetical protein